MNKLVNDQNEELKLLNDDLNIKNEKIAYQNDSLKDLINQKSEYLGMVAHDLRNPLLTISGLAELIQRRISNKRFDLDKGIKDLDRVRDASTRMKKLIDDLLSITVIESSKVNMILKKEELIEIIEEIVSYFIPIANEKSIALKFNRNPDFQCVYVNIDRRRVFQILENLLSNAVKFTAPGGEIIVDCEIRYANIIVNVRDTGQGLDSEDLNKLFKSYQTLSAKPTAGESSTGLGLAIVKKLVNLHNGEIWVKSEKGKGSTFSFSLKIIGPDC
jgi:signal transduction histidine kinase